jgi:glycerol-3-phosphate dehydrogenase
VSKSDLVSLMGGKWTIYRLMGEETVDIIVSLLKKKGFDLNKIQES